jgi:prepilin-type N-terminal cleavage/methylation domain-containing protein
MSRKGLTLLEVIIASAIMAFMFAIGYALVASTASLSQSELSLRDRQLQLQTIEDMLASELRESSSGLIRSYAFNDTLMPSSSQTVLVFVSARNALNQFQVLNARPQWQKIVLYAPYYDAALKTGELHRYEISPAPAAFTDVAIVPTVTVTATNLNVNGTLVARNGGQRLAMNLDYFKVTVTGSQVALDFSMQGNALVKQTNVDLQSGAVGRN